MFGGFNRMFMPSQGGIGPSPDFLQRIFGQVGNQQNMSGMAGGTGIPRPGGYSGIPQAGGNFGFGGGIGRGFGGNMPQMMKPPTSGIGPSPNMMGSMFGGPRKRERNY